MIISPCCVDRIPDLVDWSLSLALSFDRYQVLDPHPIFWDATAALFMCKFMWIPRFSLLNYSLLLLGHQKYTPNTPKKKVFGSIGSILPTFWCSTPQFWCLNHVKSHCEILNFHRSIPDIRNCQGQISLFFKVILLNHVKPH